MGSDHAPFIANLFVYAYENRYIEKIKKSELAIEFLRSFKEIYPSQVVLKLENKIKTEASYLDLDLKIDDRIFNLRLYDKRDAFQQCNSLFVCLISAVTCLMKCFIKP